MTEALRDDLWGTGNYAEVVKRAANCFKDPEDAVYEYVKNLLEADATTVHMDLDYATKTILVYGDGRGMDADELNRVKANQFLSDKGVEHHGSGIIAFMRIGKKLVMFSKYRKDGEIYVLSAEADGKELRSPTGKGRMINDTDKAEYEHIIRKLRRWDGGTISVIEGIGQAGGASSFSMGEALAAKKFMREMRLKLAPVLGPKSIWVKAGDEAPKRLVGKPGTGKHITIKFPGKDAETKKRAIFTTPEDGRKFELRTKIDLCVGMSNNGVIMLYENGANPVKLEDAIRTPKVSYTSVFRDQNYLRMLTGTIDFSVAALDKGPGLSVYMEGRHMLLMNGPFGDCLANQLVYADTIIKPAITSYNRTRSSDKYVKMQNALQVGMETFWQEHQKLFKEIVTTQSMDSVVVPAVTCQRKDHAGNLCCGLHTVPVRGVGLLDIGKNLDGRVDRDSIFAITEKAMYVCGRCRFMWDRYKPAGRPTGTVPTAGAEDADGHHKPMYRRSEGLNSDSQGLASRMKKHGSGYTYMLSPLDTIGGQPDPRRGAMYGSTVRININHEDFKYVEAHGSAPQRQYYMESVAIFTIIENERKDDPRTALEYMKTCAVELVKAQIAHKHGGGGVPVEEPGADTPEPKNGKSHEDAPEPKNGKSHVGSLASHWGAKMKVMA